MSPDVLVVGAGVIGASIAYHLARAGVRVTLVDRRGPAEAPGATWASAGGLRSQGRAAAERPISLLAGRRWPTLAEELEADLEASFEGHLHLAESEAELAAIEKRLADDLRGDIVIERLEGTALQALVPGLTPKARLGAYSPGDGQAHPARTARAFVAAARRLGAETRFNGVLRVDIEGGRAVARLGDERLPAGHIVLATGAWSVALLDGLGLTLPLRWRGLQMLLSDIAPRMLGPTITAVGRNLSLKQSPTGQMMLGGRWLAEPVAGETAARPVPANVPRQWAGAVALLPSMASLTVAQAWAGVEAQTADAMPLLGPAPLDALYLAAGFSNHGFQISPAIGQLVAAELTSGPQPALAPFRLDRFAGFDAEAIARFRDEPIG